MTIGKSLNKEFFIFAFLIIVSIALLLGGGYPSAVLDGISLWFATIIPSMFPYFFVCAMLSGLSLTSKISCKLSPLTTRLFRTSGVTGYAFLMSILSGYPMGAKVVSDLRKANLISQAESVRASVFCSCSSPMFMIASIGGAMMNSPLFGLCLAITHILSLFIVGIIFSFYKKNEKPTAPSSISNPKTDSLFYESVFSSVNSTLLVGGIITLFYVFIEILLNNNLLDLPITVFSSIFGNHDLGKGLVLGFFESTRGLKALSNGGITLLTLPVCGVICGFGGLSVITQSVTFLKNAKIKTAPFYLGKIIHAVLSFILGLIVSLLVF